MINTLEGKPCEECEWLKAYNLYFNLVTCENESVIRNIKKASLPRVTFVAPSDFKCQYREYIDVSKLICGGGG